MNDSLQKDRVPVTPLPGRRVVVTGTGAVSALGQDTGTFWQSLVEGRLGISQLDAHLAAGTNIRVAAQNRDFDTADNLDKKEARLLHRYSQFVVAATAEAVAQSGLDFTLLDPFRTGVIIGSGVGGLETMASEFKKLYLDGGPGRVSPLFIPMMIANMAAAKVSMIHGLKGTNLCVTTACASGTHALGEAFRAIKYGLLDACIAGGAEAPITPISLAGFDNMKALSRAADPALASLPFDRRRAGFVIGEGAGLLVLESLDQARKRGADILCEISGYGSTADAYHITSPDPAGHGAAMAMQLALAEAGLAAGDIDYINAHGTGTPLNDKYETLAIRSVLGHRAGEVKISSTKSMTGHLLGAAGALEAIATALALQNGVVPPTIGLTEADPECDLDYTPQRAARLPLKAALTNSLGFGGHNGTLCLERWDDNADKRHD